MRLPRSDRSEHVTLAGPSNLIALAVLFVLRVGAGEKMMAEQFGDEYAAYTARRKRLVPRVWSTILSRLTDACT